MIQRDFIIGDNWIYFKIYCGSNTADLILVNLIKPLSKELFDSGVIDKWFFIRYSDPKNHIRVRFYCSDINNLQLVFLKLNQNLKWYLANDLVWKLQADTYQREIERYGENTMILSEYLFYYDSIMIIDFLDLIENIFIDGDELRWLFGLKAIDSLLNSFRYEIKSKKELLNGLKVSFNNEFKMNSTHNKQVSNKYRNERKKIEDFLNFTGYRDSIIDEIDEVIKNKEVSTVKIIEEIKIHKKNVELDIFLNSQIHMLMNRLFKSKARLHEMVIYDFLYRYYDSVNSRQDKK